MPATPDEWTAERLNGTWIVRADHTVLAILEDRGPDVDQEANAKLMAAADVLLEAVEYAVDNPDFDSETFDAMCRRAIAKARRA